MWFVAMDNSSVYKLKNFIKTLNKMKADIIFLPLYSPQYAPIEMCFSLIKNKLRTIWNREVIKYHLKSDIVEIWID